MSKLAQLRKALVALAGAAATALSLGLIPEPANKYVGAALGFLSAIGVYVVPNSPTKA